MANQMDLFRPRTFSTDWEVMAVDRLERCISNDKLMAFAGILRQELDLPVNTDWNTLEFALGVNGSFTQISERLRRVTDRAAELLAEFELDLFPAGSHPTAEMFNASHVHVGTLNDEGAAVLLENRMIRYAPCFAALAANSPYSNQQGGEFKSYRVRNRAHGCTRPSSLADPRTTQVNWGSDAGPKMFGAPTYEVRIIDCASSRQLLAELATFIAAFVHYQGTLPAETVAPITPDEYRDCMTNRWLAAKHGLQATFIWEGKHRPVVEVLSEMLDNSQSALAELGAVRTDFGLIETMLNKRFTQSDFVRTLIERYPDPYQLASAWGKLMRHWDVFDTYLAGKAPVLEPIPAPDEQTILNEHLALLGEGSHFYRSREAMLYPAPVADAIIERLIEQGSVVRSVSAKHGITLSRRTEELAPEAANLGGKV